MLYRRVIKLVFLALVCVPLLGCWDSLDIQKKDITSAVFTDFDPDSGQYHFYLEIANINMSGSGIGQKSSTQFSILHSQGPSLVEAKYDLDHRADNPVYLGSTRVVFMTTRFAQAGIEEYINRIRSTLDYRKTVQIVTTSSDPSEVLSGKSENNPSVGFAVESEMTQMEKSGDFITVTVGDLLRDEAVGKVGFVLPHVNFENGDSVCSGYSLFKNNRMVGYANATDSKGLVFLLNRRALFRYEVEYNSAKIMVDVARTGLRVTPEYDGDKVRFKVVLQLKAYIMYRSEDFPLTPDLMDRFHAKLNGILAEDVRKVIEAAQSTYCSDYLQFYKYFRARYPDAFETMDWQQKFSHADIDLVIATTLQPYGLNDMQTQ